MEDDVKVELVKLEKRIIELEKKLPNQKTSNEKIGKKSIIDLLLQLKSEEFFDEPKSLKQIVGKLGEISYHYAPGSLTAPLQRAVRKGILGRIKKEEKWAYVKR